MSRTLGLVSQVIFTRYLKQGDFNRFRQEIVQSNQIIYGDITEGYDKYGIDSTVTAVYNEYSQLMYDVADGSSELFTRIIGQQNVPHQLNIFEQTVE